MFSKVLLKFSLLLPEPKLSIEICNIPRIINDGAAITLYVNKDCTNGKINCRAVTIIKSVPEDAEPKHRKWCSLDSKFDRTNMDFKKLICGY